VKSVELSLPLRTLDTARWKAREASRPRLVDRLERGQPGLGDPGACATGRLMPRLPDVGAVTVL
jgi:hypothetical protein